MVTGSGPVIGYVPFDAGRDRPGDRRRFPAHAARRGITYREVTGWEGLDVVVLSSRADMTHWIDAPPDLRVVVDLPDAVMAEQAGARSALRGVARWVAGLSRRPVLDYQAALVRMLERADAVVCSTPEQKAVLGGFCDQVEVVLDAHAEFDECDPVTPRRGDGLDVVWEGMVATLPALAQVVPALRVIAGQRPVRLHVVTDRRYPRYLERFAIGDTSRIVSDWGIPLALYQWDRSTMPAIARSCDLALVPVDLADPAALGKPENRMRIFWRLGLPVLASDSPAHRRAVVGAGISTDVLCVGQQGWTDALTRYAGDPEARADLARRGHEAAMTSYSEDRIAEGWDRVLASVGVGTGT